MSHAHGGCKAEAMEEAAGMHANCIRVRLPVDAEERAAVPAVPDTREALLARMDAVPAEALRDALADLRRNANGFAAADSLHQAIDAVEALLPNPSRPGPDETVGGAMTRAPILDAHDLGGG